jgi:excisionase family DNA binding protein
VVFTFGVGDRPVPEASEASHPFTFRTLTGSDVSPNVSPRPANHGEFAALVLHEKPMSPAQAADHLRVSRATLCRLCARGEIPHLRVGSSLRLLLADVIASLARRGS